MFSLPCRIRTGSNIASPRRWRDGVVQPTAILLLLLVAIPLAQTAAWETFDRGELPDDLEFTLLRVPEAATPHPAVVRILVVAPTGMSYGSGTVVRATTHHGLVITNWHVVQDAVRQPSSRVYVLFPDGAHAQGVILETDRKWDLAAVAIWRPNVEPVAVAAAPPSPGDSLSIIGYGRGTYREQAGRCTRFAAPDLRSPRELVELSATARQGDSGGPILNERGELAGVLFGSGPGYTLGAHSGRVRQFLGAVEPKLARLSLPGPESETQIAANDSGPAIKPNVSPVARETPIATGGQPRVASTFPSLGSNAGPGISASHANGRAMPQPAATAAVVTTSEPLASPARERERTVVETIFPFATSSRAAAVEEAIAPKQHGAETATPELVSADVMPTAAHSAVEVIQFSNQQLLTFLGVLLLLAMVASRFLHA